MKRTIMTFAIATLAVITVVDGDTIKVDGQLWRLRGFDAPETRRAKCAWEREQGRRATARLRGLLRRALETETHNTKRRDKYKRFLGDLIIDGRNVGELLIEEGLARPYKGGRRRSWCDQQERA